ncbi:MAG: hypothetical protein JWR32_147 [Mycobacterium sp.]|jgi:hypothetical protein|nr:hypothetical protein [Mycobacterium sp.]
MLRDDVLGTWEPVSYTAQDDHGGPITYPLGPDALGLIMYTGDGYMSAQIMRRDRPAFDRPETAGGTPEQVEAAAVGYLAYSGPFEVDESTGVLHQQPRVSLLPNWLNHIQIRHSKLDGDHLTLSAVNRGARRCRNHQHTGVEKGTQPPRRGAARDMTQRRRGQQSQCSCKSPRRSTPGA